MSSSVQSIICSSIYAGDFSRLLDKTFVYSTCDLSRALGVAIRKVCSLDCCDLKSDENHLLISSTIPCLIEFTLRRRCAREEAPSVFDMLITAVEMVSSVKLQQLPILCPLRDLLLSSRSLSVLNPARFLSADFLNFLKAEEESSVEPYQGFFNTFGLPETIVFRNKEVHFWLDDWENVCGHSRAVGHYVCVYMKQTGANDGTDPAMTVTAEPDTEIDDGAREWRVGCIKGCLDGGQYLVELEGRGADKTTTDQREEVTLHLASTEFYFDDKNHPHRLTVDEPEERAEPAGSMPAGAEDAAVKGGAVFLPGGHANGGSGAARLVELPSLAKYKLLSPFARARSASRAVIYSRYYFDLLDRYQRCGGFANMVTSLKNPTAGTEGTASSKEGTSTSVSNTDESVQFPTRPVLSCSTSAVPSVGYSTLEAHLRFVSDTLWTLSPALAYAQLVEFSEGAAAAFAQLVDAELRDFQVAKFNSFMLLWSELFVHQSEALVALSPKEHVEESRTTFRGNGSALSTEMFANLIVSMLKCSLITKRYLGISLLKELILKVYPSPLLSKLHASASPSAKPAVALVDGLAFSAAVLETRLLELDIFEVLFTNKYSSSCNSEFLGNADVLLMFLLLRKRVNAPELKLMWGALKVLSDNSGQHIVFKFLLTLCPHLSDSLVLSIVLLIRNTPASEVDDQFLSFVQSFAVLLVRHFKNLNTVKLTKAVDFKKVHKLPLKVNNNLLPLGVDMLFEFLLDQPVVPPEVGYGSFADESEHSESTSLGLYHVATSSLVELVQSSGLRTAWGVVVAPAEEEYLHSFFDVLVNYCMSKIRNNESVALCMRLLMRLLVARAKVGSSGFRKFSKDTIPPLRWFRPMLVASTGRTSASEDWNVESSIPAQVLSSVYPQALAASIQSVALPSSLLDVTISGLENYHEQVVAQTAAAAGSAAASDKFVDIDGLRVRGATLRCKVSHRVNVAARLEFLRFLLLFSGSAEDKAKVMVEPGSTVPGIQLTLSHLTSLWMCFMHESASSCGSLAFLRLLRELIVLENREMAQLLYMYSKDAYVSRSDPSDKVRASSEMVRAVVPPYLLSNPQALFGVGKQASTSKTGGASGGLFSVGSLERMFAEYFSPYLLRDNHIRVSSPAKLTSMTAEAAAAALSMPKHLLLVSLNLFLFVNMAHNNIVFSNYGAAGTKLPESVSSEYSVSPTLASWIRTGKLVQLQLLWKVVIDADLDPQCASVSEFGQSLLLELHHRCVGRSVLSSLKVHRYFIVMCFNHLAYAIQSIGEEEEEEVVGAVPSSVRISRRISLYISLLRRYIERFQKRLVYETTVRCIPAVSTHSLAVHKDKLPYFSLTVTGSETVKSLQDRVAAQLNTKAESLAVTGDSISLSKLTAKTVSARTVMDKFTTWMGGDAGAPRSTETAVSATTGTGAGAPEDSQEDFRQYNFVRLEKTQGTMAEAGVTPISEYKKKNIVLYGKAPAPAPAVRPRQTPHEASDAAVASVLAATAPAANFSNEAANSPAKDSISYLVVSTEPAVQATFDACASLKEAQKQWGDYVKDMESLLMKICSWDVCESHCLTDILAIGMEALGIEVQTHSPDYVQQLLVLLDGFLSVHGDQAQGAMANVEKEAGAEDDKMAPAQYQCGAVEASAWNLLSFFPTAGSILYVQVSELTPHNGGSDLCIILRQISAPYQMLYTLQIIGSLLRAPTTDSDNCWTSRFVNMGGVEVLVEVLTRLCEFITADELGSYSGPAAGKVSSPTGEGKAGCHMHRANAYVSNVAFVCRHLHTCLLLDPEYSQLCDADGGGKAFSSALNCQLLCSIPSGALVTKLAATMKVVLSIYNRTASSCDVGVGSALAKVCVQGLVEHGWALIGGLSMVSARNSGPEGGIHVLAANTDVFTDIISTICLATDEGMRSVGCRTLFFVGWQFADNCVRSEEIKPIDASQITLEPLDLSESEGSPQVVLPSVARAVELFYFFYGIVIASGRARAEGQECGGNASGYFTLVRELRECFMLSRHSLFADGSTAPTKQSHIDYFVDFPGRHTEVTLPTGTTSVLGSALCISDTYLSQMLCLHLGKLARGAEVEQEGREHSRYLNRSTYLRADRRILGSRDSITQEYATEASVVYIMDIFRLLLEQSMYSRAEAAEQFTATMGKVAVRVGPASAEDDPKSTLGLVEFLYTRCLFRRNPSASALDSASSTLGDGGGAMPLVIRLANRQKMYALLLQLAGSGSKYRLQLLRAIQATNYRDSGMSTYPWNYFPVDPDIKTFRVLWQLPAASKPAPSVTSASAYAALANGGAVYPELSPLTKHAGLINQANTCYMNSFLQQLYHVRDFTDRLLAIDINRSSVQPVDSDAGSAPAPFEYNVNERSNLGAVIARATQGLGDDEHVLVQLQYLFAQLRMNSLLALDTGGFCGVFKDYTGEPISIFEQKDINEFAGMLFDKLENSVRIAQDEPSGSFSTPVLSLLSSVFGGKVCCSIRSSVSDYRNSSSENFYMLSCEVKGFETLDESLASFTRPEKLEGEECVEDDDGVKVEAVRRYSIAALPDTLIIHLMRFEFVLATMSRKKVNDRLSFPMLLDMHRYTTAGLEGQGADGASGDSEYRLRGVVLHAGAIDRGHYYSYIQEREAPYHWYKFNDSRVSLFDEESIPDACFGGPLETKEAGGESTGSAAPPAMKIENAYMLFYEKSKKGGAAESTSSAGGGGGGANLALCPLLWKSLERQQALYVRDSFLFNESHFQFMLRLLQNCPLPTAGSSHSDGADAVVHSSTSLMLCQQYIQTCFSFAYHTVMWAQSTTCFQPFAQLLEVNFTQSTDLCAIYAHTIADLISALNTTRPPAAADLDEGVLSDTELAGRLLCKYNSWWLVVFKRSPLTQDAPVQFVSLLKYLLMHAIAVAGAEEAQKGTASDAECLTVPADSRAVASCDAPSPLPSLLPELEALDRGTFTVHTASVLEAPAMRQSSSLSVLDKALHMLLSCIECLFARGSCASAGLVGLTNLLSEACNAHVGDGAVGAAPAAVAKSLRRIGAVRRMAAWLLSCKLQAHDTYSVRLSCCKTLLRVVLKLVGPDGAVKTYGEDQSQPVLAVVDLVYMSDPAFITLALEEADVVELQGLFGVLCRSSSGSDADRALSVVKAVKDCALRNLKQARTMAVVGKCVKVMGYVVTCPGSVTAAPALELAEDAHIVLFASVMADFVGCLNLSVHTVFKTDPQYKEALLGLFGALIENKRLDQELIGRCTSLSTELLQLVG